MNGKDGERHPVERKAGNLKTAKRKVIEKDVATKQGPSKVRPPAVTVIDALKTPVKYAEARTGFQEACESTARTVAA